MGQLEGKVAIITGGAGSIGLASATLFVREGARVMLVDIDEAALRVAVESLPANSAAYTVADVTQPDDAQRYVAETVAQFGKIDVLFSNAGNIGAVAPIEEYPLDVFEAVLDARVKALAASMVTARSNGTTNKYAPMSVWVWVGNTTLSSLSANTLATRPAASP